MSSFYRVFDPMQDIVIVVDHGFGVHYANSAASMLCETSAKRFKGGKPLGQFVEFLDTLLAEGESLPSEESTPYRELAFRTSTGKEGWIQLAIQPDVTSFTSQDEGDRRWILCMRDVSLEKSLHVKYKGELDQKESVIADLKAARGQLEEYSKNLEKMVQERTEELHKSNQLLSAVLNSLGQGILVFNQKGECFPFYSRICNTLLETSPEGKHVAEILNLSAGDDEQFKNWCEAAFGDLLPFEDLIGLGPARFTHSEGREIALTFNPMRDESGAMSGIVLIATDKTEEVRAKTEAVRERAFARMVLQIVSHRAQFRSFAFDARRILADACAAVSSGSYLIEGLARDLHTLKGGASSFGLDELAKLAHSAEESLLAKHETEIKTKIFDLKDKLTGFLDKHRMLFGGKIESLERTIEVPASTIYDWCQQLSTQPAQWIEAYLKMSFEDEFSHFDSVVHELAISLGKKMKPVEFHGADLRVVPEPYTDLFSAFIHAFRNAVDHGIETPIERIAVNKDEYGLIKVTVTKISKANSPFFKICIEDDGCGVDAKKIRSRLDVAGKRHQHAHLSDTDLIQIIFDPDFSTKNEVTEISGRGVGLSALKVCAEALGGSAHVESVLGKGTRFTIEVPEIECDSVFNLNSRKAA